LPLLACRVNPEGSHALSGLKIALPCIKAIRHLSSLFQISKGCPVGIQGLIVTVDGDSSAMRISGPGWLVIAEAPNQDVRTYTVKIVSQFPKMGLGPALAYIAPLRLYGNGPCGGSCCAVVLFV